MKRYLCGQKIEDEEIPVGYEVLDEYELFSSDDVKPYQVLKTFSDYIVNSYSNGDREHDFVPDKIHSYKHVTSMEIHIMLFGKLNSVCKIDELIFVVTEINCDLNTVYDVHCS